MSDLQTPAAALDARPGFWRSLWRLTKPYWVGEDRWAGLGLLAVLIVLSLALVWVEVRLNTWNGAFYNALQEKNLADFKRLLFDFTWIAFLFIILSVYRLYLNQMLNMRWRRWLTDVHLKRWMADATHYRLSLADFGTDNPDQRIAEDLRAFVTDTLFLFFGLLSSVVTFVSFIGILWVLSGPITLGSLTIPGYMVWVAIVYAVVGSVLAHWVGKPLIGLNFQQERFEADFRFSLVRARENAEGIALYHGQADELRGFRDRFARLVDNWWQIMKRQKRFTWFASFYGQLAIIFPILVAAPRYFSGAIQLGGLMQISNAFGKVQESLSWLVDAYTRIASWRAAIARLDGFDRAMLAARRLGEGAVSEAAAGANHIDLGQVSIGVPMPVPMPASAGAAGGATPTMTAAAATTGGAVAAGTPVKTSDAGVAPGLPSPADPDPVMPSFDVTDPPPIGTRPLILTSGQTIEPGNHTLITGPSGSGKSTLFRLLAGIWPFASGHLVRAGDDESLFLPQKPYLPLGSLRSVVSYPRQDFAGSDQAITDALVVVGLDGLTGRLDEVANWSQILSGGEQQRLAAARALLIQPRWLFVDEATSALDEAAEARIYQAWLERLPDTTLVSIAHRPAVARFHRQVIRVEPVSGSPAALSQGPIAA